jgi:hypothetical protein
VPQLEVAQRRRFDWLGAAASSSGLILIVVGLELASHSGSRLSGAIAVTVAAFLLLFYVRHARHAAAPILDLTLLRIASFRIAALGGTLFRIAFGVIPFLVPMMLQLCLGRSALQSGLLTSIGTAGGLVMKGMARGIAGRFGFRRVLLGNGIAAVFCLLCCAAFTRQTPFVLLFAVLLAAGLVRSLQFNVYGSIGYVDVSSARMSAATPFNDMLQQLSLGVGVSLGALMLAAASGLTGDAHLARPDFVLAFIGAAAIASLSLPPATGECLLPDGVRARRLPTPAPATTAASMENARP